MEITVYLQYYHTPDCPTAARPYALVERLGREHDVTVVTTTAWDDDRRTERFPWIPPGVDLVRFDVPYENSMSPRQRLVSFLRYAGRAVRYGLSAPTPDLIIGSSTPLTAAAAAGVVATVRSVPWIFEVRDLWPDFPIQMDAVPDYGLHSLLRLGERTLYRSANRVVALSPDMEQHVQHAAPSTPVETLPYGSDFELIEEVTEDNRAELCERYDLDDRPLVLYPGTFGRANAIPTMLEAARRVLGRRNCLFVFAGQGHHKPEIEAAANEHESIRLLPPLAYPNALTLFSRADLSLVPFIDRPVLAANAPGKFFDSLATGTPVIVTNPGWTKRFVEEHECGWYVPPDSPTALADTIDAACSERERLDTVGEHARAAAEWSFRRSEVMDRYAALVREVTDAAA